MDLDNNKVEVDWFYLKKIAIGTVRGNQFLYIYIYIYIYYLKLVTNIVLIAIVFLF